MRIFLITTAQVGYGDLKTEMNIIRLEKYPDRSKVIEEVKKQNKHAMHGAVIAISELSEQDVIDYNKLEY
jgi:hypothetical protein